MGGSGNWIKSLITNKKAITDDQVISKISPSLSQLVESIYVFFLTEQKHFSFLFQLSDKNSKKKWKLWRTSSSENFTFSSKGFKSRAASYGTPSLGSDPPSFSADDNFTAAVAAVIRAPPKDFFLFKREWAATRIQAAFRAFLVRDSMLHCSILLNQMLVSFDLVICQLVLTLMIQQPLVTIA